MEIDLDIVNKLFNFGGKINQITEECVYEANAEIKAKQQKPTELKRHQNGNEFPTFKSKRKSVQCEKSDKASSKEDKASDEMLLLSTFGGMVQCQEKENEISSPAVPPGLDPINTKRRANPIKRTIRFSNKVIILGADMEKKKGRTKKKARDKNKPLKSALKKKKENLVNSTREIVCQKKKHPPVGQTAEESCTIEFHFEANDRESISVIKKQDNNKRKKSLTETQEICKQKKFKPSESEPISEHIDKMINSAIEAMTGNQCEEETQNECIPDCITASMIEPLQSTRSEVPETYDDELLTGQNEKSGGCMDSYPALFHDDSFSEIGGHSDDSCDLAVDSIDQVSAAKTDAVPQSMKNEPTKDAKAPKSHPPSQLSEMRKPGHSIVGSASSIVPKHSPLKTEFVKEKSFGILSTNSESDFESDEEITLAGLIKKTKQTSSKEVLNKREIAQVLANIHSAKEPTDSSTISEGTLGQSEQIKVLSNKENNRSFKSCKELRQEERRNASFPEECSKDRQTVSGKARSLEPEADLLNKCQEIAGNPQKRTVTTIGQLNEKMKYMGKSPNSRSSRTLAVYPKGKQLLKSKKIDPKSSIGFNKMDSEGKMTPVGVESISQGKLSAEVNSQSKSGIKVSSTSSRIVGSKDEISLPLPVQEEIRQSFIKMFVNGKGSGNASALNSGVKTQEMSAMKAQQRPADDIIQTVKQHSLSVSSSGVSDKWGHQFPSVGHDAETFHLLDFERTSPEKARIARSPDLLDVQQKSQNFSLPACDNMYDMDRQQQYAKADTEHESGRQDKDMIHNRDDHHTYTRPNASSSGEQCNRADHGNMLQDIQRQLSQLQQQVNTLQRNYDAIGGGKQHATPVQSQPKTHESVQIDPEIRQLCQQLVSTQKDVLNLERTAQCTQINAIRGARLRDNSSSGLTTEGRSLASLNGPAKKQNITLRIVVERNGCKSGKCGQKCSK